MTTYKLTELFSQFQETDNIKVLEPLLTRKQLLSYFQITDNTLSDMIEDGMPYLKVKERPRYDKEEVLKYLRKQTLSITKVGK